MIDVKKKIFDAYFSALDGQITFKGSPVPVVDEKLATGLNNTMYVVISSQTSIDESSFSHLEHETTILIDICHKTQDVANKKGVNEVAQQIFDIVRPTVTTTGIVAQSGVQITNVLLESDQSLSFELTHNKSLVRRLIRFRQFITEL